ncbi:hypothetical protein OOZ63_27885 [Paucibacter sp. PLA-PC-4]|uniref:hypothetical protein n=1 Tax=Paucibacter sp. PLA-PC-4 TaxID=2993655 RepID=UPI00224A9C16|nr:hypothetical protein [Paucibacter sp. PLA-PC-4]MCX2865647.1 hypothetical protein [Paucibacter sp. PLA-PC-4]
MDIKQYLAIRAERSKNLVIGCGTTPERVMMGTMPGTACSLGSDHHNDFTVDVSSDASPNLTLDFSQSKGSDLLAQGKGHFDKVTFEYLNRGPRNRFSEAEVKGWIEGADTMLKDKSGEILFYNGDSRYRAQARSAMEERGYTVTDVKEDPSTTSPNGHVYCKGKKDDSLTSQFWRLFGG